MPILPASPILASAFLERLLAFLVPFFSGFTSDLAAARAEALETLTSYGARTRAELLCAMQIIVFSFAALETMAEAGKPEMSPSMRIRYRGCANNLSRSSQKAEQTLTRRLACDVPKATDVLAEPVADVADDVAEEIMQQTQAMVQNYCDRAAAGRTVQAAASIGTPVHLAEAENISGNRAASADHPAPNSLIGDPPASNDHPAQDAASMNRSSGNVQPEQMPAMQTDRLPPRQPAPISQNQSAPLTQQEQNKRLWGAAMMETLAQMGMPVTPAVTDKAGPPAIG